MTTRPIQVLPENLANKIAAGEVIQRPESVVKELLENSLDAGAENITVVIKEGGRKLIQVIDDGLGMNEQDAVTSFLRHATSKIATYEDLEAIMTYGFRGEALASIAAVAQVTMKTRHVEDDAATVVQVDGGGAPRVSKEGRERGTSIAVHNLFYNTPARRKFLKSNTTEFRHVYDAIQRAALSHPEIALRFVNNDETILDLKPAPLADRVLDVFGQRFSEGIVWLEEKSPYISVHGYIGKPTFGQKSRVNQFLFLNNRFIVNRNINHAVFSAYEHLLIKGTYPFFLLFLHIDPHRVDVNVHPSKLEAKFEDEQNIHHFVSTVVRKTLSVNNLIPAAALATEGIEMGSTGLKFTDRQHRWGMSSPEGGAANVDRSTGELVSRGPLFPFDEAVPARTGGTEMARQLLGGAERDSKSEEVPGIQISSVLQIHGKYIVAEVEGGLLITDQHVAHERVLYEHILRKFEQGKAGSQQLVFPQAVELTPGDHSLLVDLMPHFEEMGFMIKEFGRNTVMVEGIPPEVKPGTESTLLTDLLSLYRDYRQQSPTDVRDTLAKSLSCRAAVKSGDHLSEPEMRSLITQLQAATMPYVCPHGRPVMLRISLEELDRRFGRT